MTYRRRAIDGIIDDIFPSLPALLLDGPKAVGKTTSALQRAKTVRNLDVEGTRLRASVDPEWVVKGDKPILIDEWHRVADTWSAVKRAVDADHSGGQFILTGSMPDSSTHSGAGRITAI
ncbi:MAG TPA: AAA family ATPase, partial [Microbacteriaceae bacterium]|nr:AAA family ATPase [Microbacteriaceae bacterium]